MTRKLSLKRDVLTELSSDELTGVVAGTLKPTAYSCLDYISCYALQCVTRWTIVCVE
jgi:hypothetical protein